MEIYTAEVCVLCTPNVQSSDKFWNILILGFDWNFSCPDPSFEIFQGPGNYF